MPSPSTLLKKNSHNRVSSSYDQILKANNATNFWCPRNASKLKVAFFIPRTLFFYIMIFQERNTVVIIGQRGSDKSFPSLPCHLSSKARAAKPEICTFVDVEFRHLRHSTLKLSSKDLKHYTYKDSFQWSPCSASIFFLSWWDRDRFCVWGGISCTSFPVHVVPRPFSRVRTEEYVWKNCANSNI